MSGDEEIDTFAKYSDLEGWVASLGHVKGFRALGVRGLGSGFGGPRDSNIP